MSEVTFKYRNHRGEERTRRVVVKSIDFIATSSYGYQPGWFLVGYDLDKHAIRSFRLSHIIFEQPHGTNLFFRIPLQ